MSTYAVQRPDTGEITAVGQRFAGNIVIGDRRIFLPAGALNTYGWYPEQRPPLEAYSDGYDDLPTIIDDIAVYGQRVPDSATRKQRALDALDARLAQERERRVGIITTGIDRSDDMMGGGDITKLQLSALMQSLRMVRREARGAATEGETDVLDIMDGIQDEIAAVDHARGDILLWARDNLPDWEAVDKLNPNDLPPEAPKWPLSPPLPL